MTALLFVLCLLAIYRVCTDLTSEDGPYDVLSKARGWMLTHTPKGVHGIVTCPICMSWWLAIPAACGAILVTDQPLVYILLWWPALAGGVAALCRRQL